MAIYFSIAEDVFDIFPSYCRGIVIAEGIDNTGTRAEITRELRAAEKSLQRQLGLEVVTAHPRLAAWREAYRSTGIKPSEFRPSVEAMARRVLRGDSLPLINPIVDLGNAVSLRYLLPIGAHAIDVLTSDISLRQATGTEVFEPFGSGAVEHPQPGEFVFVESERVLTRRWTWRQANHTLVVPETRAVEVNVDGLPPVTRDEVEQICQELAGLITKYCGGSARYELLWKENLTILLIGDKK